MTLDAVLYAVVEKTPDYTACTFLSTEMHEAQDVSRSVYGAEIHEIRLAEVALYLIGQGLSRIVVRAR